jgi:hypothetical protein
VAPAPATEAPEVRIDGRALDAAMLGVALPVDPGSHVIELRTGARTVDRRRIVPREGERLELELGEVVSAPPPAPVVRAPHVPLLPDPMVADRAPAATSRRWWVWAVAGAAAIGASAALIAAWPRGAEAPQGNVDTWRLGR